MTHDDLYVRTAKGTLEARNRASALPPELLPVLRAVDGETTVAQLAGRLQIAEATVQQALQHLHDGGYLEAAAATANDDDLDFATPGAMSRLQAQAEARARAEAAARARVEQARRDAADAQHREQEQARLHAAAEAQAQQAAAAHEQAQATARAADQARSRAAQEASSAQDAASQAAAQAQLEAARAAETRAAAQARATASAVSAAQAALVHSQDAAERARAEAQARARAESEAQARAHAEAHARAMVEAQLKAMGAALARAEALAREEAEARARLAADLQARDTAEAQARSDAAARARAEAETEMRAELARLRDEAQQALAQADARAEAERQAREAAEARAAEQLEAQRRAHAAARAATQARVAEEQAARAAAESRAQAEIEARVAHESAVRASAEDAVRSRVAEEMRAREAAERAADAQYRAEAARRAQRAAAEPSAPRAPAYAPRRPRAAAAAKAGGVALLALAGATALLMPLVPLDGYVRGVEQAMTAALGRPVSVARLQYRMLPTPELVLERVAAGAAYGSRAERVAIAAWPWELLGSSPATLDRVTVQGAALDHEGLAALAHLLTRTSDAPRLERLSFENGRLAVQDVELPVSSAALQFAGGALRSVRVVSGGASLKAAAEAAGAWRVSLDARDWRPPVDTALRFESFTLAGIVSGRGLQRSQVRGRVAGGEVTGYIAADWSSGIRAEGEFQLTQAQLQRLLSAHAPHFTAQGVVTAQGRYALEAPTLGKVLAAPRITADFRIHAGELSNVDVVQALQQVTSKPVHGGRTRFEQLAGTVEVSGGRYRYREIRLTSGPMSAYGHVEVAPGHRLAGRVTADVQAGSRTAIRGVLAVSGTLTNPVLRP